jgi:hypothetical protein
MDAELLLDQLNEAGIAAMLRNRDLESAIGEFPWSTRPEVCILDPNDLPRALSVKEAYVSARSNPVVGQERQCPHCHELSPPNFELCWKCRKPFAG